MRCLSDIFQMIVFYSFIKFFFRGSFHENIIPHSLFSFPPKLSQKCITAPYPKTKSHWGGRCGSGVKSVFGLSIGGVVGGGLDDMVVD